MKIIDQFDASLQALKDLRDRVNSNEKDLEKKNEIIKNQNDSLTKQGKAIKELKAILKDSLNGMDCDVITTDGERIVGLVLTPEFVKRIKTAI